MRTFFFLVALLVSQSAHAQTSTVTVEVDVAQVGAPVRDLFGVNRKPTFSAQTPGLAWNAASLYPAFGVSQVRLHDANLDLCTTYTAASKLNAGVSPAANVAGCTLAGSGGAPHFKWTPTSSADADLNNPANYDFTSVDEALGGAIAAGAAVYLRLGESYNGPNDTGDPVAWAKVATNIYKHVLGRFKPSAGIAVDPAFVEVFNEPDGGFWRGDTTAFNTLFVETVQRVRAAAAAAGKTVHIGGPGFTRSILTSSAQAGNPANGFIAAVGASNLDFYSAHHYGSCSTATLAASATFLRALRSLVNSQGGSAKPLHITEWNIGLGSQCGNAFFAEQRTQSFAGGVLTLMQDPEQNIEAAHFYAAVPLMALFDSTSLAGAMRINPSAWAFFAHSRLRGGNALGTRVCSSANACVAGYAAESQPVMALAAKSDGKQNIVITNDGSAAVDYTLRLKGLAQATLSATISTPPSGVRDVPANGNPATVDAAALAALLASPTRDLRSNLAVSGGQLELLATIPAHSVQWVEVQSPVSAATAIEYYHAGFGHYFITASPEEADLIDSGVLQGWSRTGETFKVYTLNTPGAANVCRFFTTSFAPKSSHFYTPSATECASVKGNPNWQYEGLVFSVAPAASSSCPTGTVPIYRLYNNGQSGAPNHRYTASPAIVSTMAAQGWANEGVSMCSPL
ncbi:MAG: hypothetical protein HY777_08765 [Betaproteobacteria bacterium]|nr:hypothetical protein [Betaproteobacteria bacterium]